MQIQQHIQLKSITCFLCGSKRQTELQCHIQLKSITCFLCGSKRQTELQCQTRDNKKCKVISLSNFHKIYLILCMPLC
jgi:hypothetical protein